MQREVWMKVASYAIVAGILALACIGGIEVFAKSPLQKTIMGAVVALLAIFAMLGFVFWYFCFGNVSSTKKKKKQFPNQHAAAPGVHDHVLPPRQRREIDEWLEGVERDWNKPP